MPNLMTDEEIQSWILRRLGAPFWKIELTCDHLTDALDDAKRWFLAKKGVRRALEVYIAPGQTQVLLGEDVDLVLEVVSSQSATTISPIADEFGFNQIVIGPGLSYNSYAYSLSDIVQRLQYSELAKRVLNSEFEWWQEDSTLHLSPKATVGGKIVVYYKSHSLTTEQLNERDHLYIKEYALAKAKEMLGRIRSKYSEFATSTGTVSLDGQALLDEARTEIERLDESIKESGLPMPFLTG